MNDGPQGQPWGMCVAFGCPLLGTMGGEGKWYCFCHVGRPSAFNDAITRHLREHERAIVDLTLAIRRDSLTGKWSREAALAVKAMADHPLSSELDFSKENDVSSRGWLYRLERHLIGAVAGIGEQQKSKSTATIILPMPKHAASYHPYGDGADA
jgi:hypothetical protein